MSAFLKAIAFARNLQKTMIDAKACADKHCAKEKKALHLLQEKKIQACQKRGDDVYTCAQKIAHDKEYLKKRMQAHTCINKHCKKMIEASLSKYMNKKKTSSKKTSVKKTSSKKKKKTKTKTKRSSK